MVRFKYKPVRKNFSYRIVRKNYQFHVYMTLNGETRVSVFNPNQDEFLEDDNGLPVVDETLFHNGKPVTE